MANQTTPGPKLFRLVHDIPLLLKECTKPDPGSNAEYHCHELADILYQTRKYLTFYTPAFHITAELCAKRMRYGTLSEDHHISGLLLDKYGPDMVAKEQAAFSRYNNNLCEEFWQVSASPK